MMSDLSGSSLILARSEIAKDKKRVEEYTPDIKVMDLYNFEFDEIILKDVVVLNTPVTYFVTL